MLRPHSHQWLVGDRGDGRLYGISVPGIDPRTGMRKSASDGRGEGSDHDESHEDQDGAGRRAHQRWT